MQWKMLSGLEHEVRSQLSNKEHKRDILLNDQMEPDSLGEVIFFNPIGCFIDGTFVLTHVKSMTW